MRIPESINLMNDFMNMRPTNLVCISKSDGIGYDKKHTIRLEEVMDALKHNPTICIVENPDVICSACPGDKKGTCKTQVIKKLDLSFLELLGLTYNQTYLYSDVLKKINAHTLECKRICTGCEWFNKCYK